MRSSKVTRKRSKAERFISTDHSAVSSFSGFLVSLALGLRFDQPGITDGPIRITMDRAVAVATLKRTDHNGFFFDVHRAVLYLQQRSPPKRLTVAGHV